MRLHTCSLVLSLFLATIRSSTHIHHIVHIWSSLARFSSKQGI